MSNAVRYRCAFYALIAIAALLGTGSENLHVQGTSPIQLFANFLAGLKVNAASRSISIDISLFLLAGATFMIVEARRLRIRLVWVYVVLSFLVAVSVTFPIFLLAREVRLARMDQAPTKVELTTLDYAGIALTTALVLWVCWYLKT
jgi:hypothetical protein